MRKTKIAILHPSLFFSSLKNLCYNDAWKAPTNNFARFGFLCSKSGMKNRDGNWCENRCGNQCENRCGNRCENCGKEKRPPFFSALLFFRGATPLAKMRSFFFAAVFAPVSAPLFALVSAPVFKPVSVAIFHTFILTKNQSTDEIVCESTTSILFPSSNLFVNVHLHPHHQKKQN